MYLSKQWRESRILTILAAIALVLFVAILSVSAIKVTPLLDRSHNNPQDIAGGIAGSLVGFFYAESLLVAFWGWLAGGIGAGKTLGEGGGSFLFTRPRRRAWFLWSDWGYAMVHIAVILIIANLTVGLCVGHVLAYLHMPDVIQLGSHSWPVSLSLLMVMIGIGALLFAGLIYGLSYLCTILIKRTAGVMLAAGIMVAYLILLGVFHHYYPGVHTPDLIMNVFGTAFGHGSLHGASGPMSLSIAVRVIVMLLFPLAAQFVLERSDV